MTSLEIMQYEVELINIESYFPSSKKCKKPFEKNICYLYFRFGTKQRITRARIYLDILKKGFFFLSPASFTRFRFRRSENV